MVSISLTSTHHTMLGPLSIFGIRSGVRIRYTTIQSRHHKKRIKNVYFYLSSSRSSFPHILSPKILMDCFRAFHDPTIVCAVGKHLQGTGQYRSCIFVTSHEMDGIAREALNDCRRQLNKDLSTHVCRRRGGVASCGGIVVLWRLVLSRPIPIKW
jgi:hypothetical protein